MRAPDTPGGFHNIFMYKHSSGAPLLFATTSGRHANVYDMSLFVQGDSAQGLVGQMPWPSTATPSPYGMLQGYHDFYVAFDYATGKDMAYGAGLDGYYVYDVTDPANPVLETSIVGVLGVQLAHTMSATPDHKYAVGQTEYLYSPVRLYDLQPGLSGEVETINEEMAVWTPNWRGFTHNHEMRWPYVFVSSFEDGPLRLQHARPEESVDRRPTSTPTTAPNAADSTLAPWARATPASTVPGASTSATPTASSW